MGYCCGGYSGASQPEGGCAGYACGSPLEYAVSEYSVQPRMSEESFRQSAEAMTAVLQSYAKGSSAHYSDGKYLNQSKQAYVFSPNIFLKDVPTEFISSGNLHQNKAVASLVEEAFEASTGRKMPDDIAVRICSEEELKNIHESCKAQWSCGIKGFSINRRGFGMNQVFVREDELARLMLTIGHEIGHVISLPMKNPVDEEAKAFAFSIAWMDAVRKNNIGGLSEVIHPAPADNGLHNVAFGLVAEQMKSGKSAAEIYLEVLNGEISINSRIPVF